MINKVILVGRLGKDPEIRYTPGGVPIALLSVATDRWYTKDGKKEKKTLWHRVVCFGNLAQNIQDFLKKGSLIYLEGTLDYRKFTTSSGIEREITEIVANEIKFLQKKDRKENGKVRERVQENQRQRAWDLDDGDSNDDSWSDGNWDDDVPF